jgi:hypothetical protein
MSSQNLRDAKPLFLSRREAEERAGTLKEEKKKLIDGHAWVSVGMPDGTLLDVLVDENQNVRFSPPLFPSLLSNSGPDSLQTAHLPSFSSSFSSSSSSSCHVLSDNDEKIHLPSYSFPLPSDLPNQFPRPTFNVYQTNHQSPKIQSETNSRVSWGLVA